MNKPAHISPGCEGKEEEGKEEKRAEERGHSGLLRRNMGQTEAGWVEGRINSFAAGAPTYKSAAEDLRSIVNLVIVCYVSRKSSSFAKWLRQGRE